MLFTVPCVDSKVRLCYWKTFDLISDTYLETPKCSCPAASTIIMSSNKAQTLCDPPTSDLASPSLALAIGVSNLTASASSPSFVGDRAQ